ARARSHFRDRLAVGADDVGLVDGSRPGLSQHIELERAGRSRIGHRCDRDQDRGHGAHCNASHDGAHHTSCCEPAHSDKPRTTRGAAMPRIIFEKDVAIPMRDGCVLRGDLFRPDSPEKLPVVINRTPYNKAMPMVFALTLDSIRAASAGYNVLLVD